MNEIKETKQTRKNTLSLMGVIIVLSVSVVVSFIIIGGAFTRKEKIDPRLQKLDMLEQIKIENQTNKVKAKKYIQLYQSGLNQQKIIENELKEIIFGTGEVSMTNPTEEAGLPAPLSKADKQVENKTYTTANGTIKKWTEEMSTLLWRLNSNGKSKQYIQLNSKGWYSRSKEFLGHYGLEYSFDKWVEFSQKYYIKIPAVVCIARADSGLGTEVLSKNNIGNVGNNDRGNRIEYDSLNDGIEAIFRVLNNKYLGQYKLIGELSTGGVRRLGFSEEKRYYYATSQENWNINVLNCLSMIYNEPVTENFEFRLLK